MHTLTDPITTPTEQFPMPRASGCPFDPPPAGRILQQDQPVAHVALEDGTAVWYVTRHAEARSLLAGGKLSSEVTRPGYPLVAARDVQQSSEKDPEDHAGAQAGLSFILMDDPEHARLRRMVTAPFAVKRIEAMRPAIQKITDDLIDQLLAGPNPSDLVEAFALPLPSLVICELLGVPYEDHGFFQEQSNAIIRRTTGPDERRAASERLAAYLGGLLHRKTETPQDDLFSEIGSRVSAGELTVSAAIEMGILLLIAGHETTANMIALGTLALLQHPSELERLRHDPDPALIASSVEELLRYLTITHDGRKRVALEDIPLGDVLIRAGDGVIIATDVANRDDQVFDGPDSLRLDRNPRQHLAFGFGPHQCLGQPLARVELQVVYPTLFRRIPTLSLAAPIEEIPFKNDGTVYGVYQLPVTWCPER